MTQTKKGVVEIKRPPTQRSSDGNVKSSSGGGAGIGDSSVNGTKNLGLGSKVRLFVKPRCCKAT